MSDRGLMTSVPDVGTPMPALPRATPAEHGVDPASLAELSGRLAADDLGVDSLMVLRHGAVLLERWWHGQSPSRAHEMLSVTKSFVSTAIGMACDEDLLSVDEPVLAFFPTYASASVRANVGAMSLRHLLTMSSGHRSALWPMMKDRPDEDWVRIFLETPLELAPGVRFRYSSANSHLLSAALANRTGRTVAEFLAPRLFEPLGIAPPRWDTDSRGIPEGGRGMWLRTADVAALGQLYLDGGRWRDRRLVSQDWVEQATTAQIDTGSPDQTKREWAQGYGFQFWRGLAGTFRADGAYGQFAVVHPARDIVVAVTASSRRTYAILEAIRGFLEHDDER
ncbi:MAG: beta-lactamase [Streptosporangiaceae bacterium]|nr:beta-lactamase [Streptosporangiaceae bacterium]